MPIDARVVGPMVHVLSSVALHTARTFHQVPLLLDYGAEVVLTAEIIAANRDKFGHWELLDLIDDPEEQRRRFGRVILGRGPWPEGKDRIQPGTPAWDEARDRARAAAFGLPESERAAALAEIRAKYGLPDSARSRTLMEYKR